MDNKDATLVKQYQEFTRYLRPVKQVAFSDREMLQCLMHYLEPDDIASATQLLGDRRGVIRITFKSRPAVKKLEEMVGRKKLQIHGLPLGLVDDIGQFLMLTLENVPQYISEDLIEEEMRKFGTVAGSTRDYVEYKGRKIENERRKVFFTSLLDKAQIPKEITIAGSVVFLSYRGQDTGGGSTSRSSRSTSLSSSQNNSSTSSPSKQQHLRELHTMSSGESPTFNPGNDSPPSSSAAYKKQQRANALQLLDSQLN